MKQFNTPERKKSVVMRILVLLVAVAMVVGVVVSAFAGGGI